MTQDWMGDVNRNYEQNEEQKSGGISGIEPTVVKFLEGTSFFRILPSHTQVQAILEALQTGDWAKVRDASAVMPCARVGVYLPGRNDDDAGGLSLFNEARVSPWNVWPGEPETLKVPDPIDKLLEDEGIRWEKTENLDARGKAIRAATKRSDRVFMQIVNLGINGSEWKHGESTINLLFLSSKDFEEKFKYNLLGDPASRQYIPMDIYYGGINFQVHRKGKNRDTTYQMQGVYPQQQNGWGYPLFMAADRQNIDYAESQRVLQQIKPWGETCKKATPEELEAAWKELIVKIDKKFTQGAVQIPGMPGGNSGATQPPGAPPSGPTSPPVGQPGTPPASTPPTGAPPSSPPASGAPSGPPSGPPSSAPAAPPSGPPAASAPTPPAFGQPPSGHQSAPATPPNAPNLGQQQLAPPPGNPPASPPAAPGGGAPINPGQMQGTVNNGPPAAPPTGVPGSPPGAPPAGAR